jgi:flagellar biosynthetic protein FliP
MRRRFKPLLRVGAVLLLLTAALVMVPDQRAAAQERIPIPRIDVTVGEAEEPRDVALSLEILFLLTVLTLAPAIIISVTSFTRIAIVFSFLRRALTLQQEPPNQIILALAIFLTIFIMAPTIQQVNQEALQPYFDNQIDSQEMFQRALDPIREFMFRQTREKDIALFIRLGAVERPANQSEVPTWVLVPAFMISEITTAFKIGILLFLPFIIIDLVVASVLMSMGIIFLPPVFISLPFKIILFILIDGWHLLTYQVVNSFR